MQFPNAFFINTTQYFSCFFLLALAGGEQWAALSALSQRARLNFQMGMCLAGELSANVAIAADAVLLAGNTCVNTHVK